jgi:hypothetical protein
MDFSFLVSAFKTLEQSCLFLSCSWKGTFFIALSISATMFRVGGRDGLGMKFSYLFNSFSSVSEKT